MLQKTLNNRVKTAREQFHQDKLRIATMRPQHTAEVAEIIRIVDGKLPHDPAPDCMTARDVTAQIQRFPEGQFVALIDGQVVGFAITMRTQRSPYDPPLPWLDAIGGLDMRAHNRRGEWLYGVDFAVHPDFRKRGIGTKLYRDRFNMVKRLNLRGFYAGGMLAGYEKYHQKMNVMEYGRKVMNGEINDPTVTMQINRGFKPAQVIRNYCGDTPDCNAMLIVWDNPQYQFA